MKSMAFVYPFLTTRFDGKSERPSSPPHPALGSGCGFADGVRRASDFPVISKSLSSSMRRR